MLPADAAIMSSLVEPPSDFVTCMEVIEHLYDPQSLLRGCLAAVRPGGTFICRRAYHGYLKNLAIALLDRWDKHVGPWFGGGQVKFFNRHSLLPMMREAGFVNLRLHGVGRLPNLGMSTVVAGDKPV
jgi:2-polyprenyl-3-methyl-5-hydroxy-6-metoxy-1,4-benzoquinol methylase